jgi:hypothetical protein
VSKVITRVIFLIFSMVWFVYSAKVATTEFEQAVVAGIYLVFCTVITMWVELASKR